MPRVGVLIGGLVAAVVIAWFSQSGQALSGFRARVVRGNEAGRMAEPQGNITTTGIVFVFVVIMAIFLFLVDKSLEWVLYDRCFPGAKDEWQLRWQLKQHRNCRRSWRAQRRAPAAAGTKRWYVVHAYSGMEKSVARALQERIDRAGMQAQFGQILVPVEEVVEMKSGEKIDHRAPHVFPGYVLVEMEMNDDTWHLVKNTSKVTGFRRRQRQSSRRRSRQKEVDKIMSRCRRASRSRGRRRCSRWARWCGSRKVRLPTSTATSKK